MNAHVLINNNLDHLLVVHIKTNGIIWTCTCPLQMTVTDLFVSQMMQVWSALPVTTIPKGLQAIMQLMGPSCPRR